MTAKTIVDVVLRLDSGTARLSLWTTPARANLRT
jgi:hypothetical protein